MKNIHLRGKTITIVGPHTFETLLKAHYLTHATGVICRLFSEERSKHPSAEHVVSSSNLVLIDCENGKIESSLSEMKKDSQLNGIFQKPLVLFNVDLRDIQETGTVNDGIMGLLPTGAPPDVFLEVVSDALSKKELTAA